MATQVGTIAGSNASPPQLIGEGATPKGTIERLELPRQKLTPQQEAAIGRGLGGEPPTAERASGAGDLDVRDERRRMLAERLAQQYSVLNGVYADPARPDAPLFRADGERRIVAHDVRSQSVRAMVDLAESKGWTAIRVEGVPELQRAVWIEATSREIHVQFQASRLGPVYQPTAEDRIMAARLHEARFGVRARGESARQIGAIEPGVFQVPDPSSVDASPRGAGDERRTGAEPAKPGPRDGDLQPARSTIERSPSGDPLTDPLRAQAVFDMIEASRLSVSDPIRPLPGVALSASLERGQGVAADAMAKTAMSSAVRLLELQLRGAGFSAKERSRILAKAVEKESQLTASGLQATVKVYDPTAPRETERVVKPVRPPRQQRERTVGR
jgi:conjugative element/phage-associated large polyvalent protein